MAGALWALVLLGLKFVSAAAGISFVSPPYAIQGPQGGTAAYNVTFGLNPCVNASLPFSDFTVQGHMYVLGRDRVLVRLVPSLLLHSATADAVTVLSLPFHVLLPARSLQVPW
jgi:hypothetical protein